MIKSAEDTLGLIESYLPVELVSRPALSDIKTLAGLLPDAMSFFGVECRLGNMSSRVDFGACMFVSEGGQEVLAAHLQGMGASLQSEAHDIWHSIRAFCLRWADPSSLFHERIPLVSFEFDTDRQSSDLPAPCPFVCLTDRLGDHADVANPGDYQVYRQVAEETLAALRSSPVSPELRANLNLCFDALPVDGHIAHVGVMLARRTEALRFCIGLSEDSVLAYLTNIGWPGSMAQVENLLSTYLPCVDRFYLSLDVGHAVLPGVGLEFFLNRLSGNKYRGIGFLDLLLERGLCTVEERHALLAWPGSSRETYPADSEPTILNRQLSHIKIVCRQPEDPLAAKAYLLFGPTAGAW